MANKVIEWSDPEPEAIAQMTQSIIDVVEVCDDRGMDQATTQCALQALRFSSIKSTTKWNPKKK